MGTGDHCCSSSSGSLRVVVHAALAEIVLHSPLGFGEAQVSSGHHFPFSSGWLSPTEMSLQWAIGSVSVKWPTFLTIHTLPAYSLHMKEFFHKAKWKHFLSQSHKNGRAWAANANIPAVSPNNSHVCFLRLWDCWIWLAMTMLHCAHSTCRCSSKNQQQTQ